MVDDWPIKTIAECASHEPYSTQIGPFGKALTPEEYTESGVPLLRGVNVNHGRFHDDDFVFISEDTANRLAKFESFPGDVLLVHKGTLGKIGLMPKDRRFHRYIMGNSMLRVRCNPQILISEYLYYWLSSADGTHYLLSRVSQVGVPQIQQPLTTLRECALPVPPLREQQTIAGILGSLDDKIELNRRMNETLEAMTRTLFKSWFIDFDPVRAKADGRDPDGMNEATARLFPDTFEDSDLGEIPKDWTVGTFADVAVNPRRNVQARDIKPSTPYIGLEHMPRRSITLSSWGASENIESNKSTFSAGEILFGKLRPYFHKVGVAPVSGVCSTDILVVAPRTPTWFAFMLGHVSSVDFVNHTDASSTGTKMPRTNWGDMSRYELVIPPEELARRFTQLIKPFTDRIISNIHESRNLAHVRDALLPKLLSGELRIKDAERFVEAAL